MKTKLIKLIAVFVLALILVAFVVFKNEKTEKVIPLKATVSYDSKDKKFIIRNTDTLDFVHADIAIDESFKLNDFNLKVDETYTIWQVEFVHYNGTPYSAKYKPRIFSIWCEVNDGRKGFYSKKFR